MAEGFSCGCPSIRDEWRAVVVGHNDEHSVGLLAFYLVYDGDTSAGIMAGRLYAGRRTRRAAFEILPRYQAASLAVALHAGLRRVLLEHCIRCCAPFAEGAVVNVR